MFLKNAHCRLTLCFCIACCCYLCERGSCRLLARISPSFSTCSVCQPSSSSACKYQAPAPPSRHLPHTGTYKELPLVLEELKAVLSAPQMPRVRWADLGPDEDAAAADEPPQDAVEDAWGPQEEPAPADPAFDAVVPTRAVSQAQHAALAALLSATQRQSQHQDRMQQAKVMRGQTAMQQQQQPPMPQQPQKHQVPSLHKLCMGVLGQHVQELVEQLGDTLQWLPPDVRAALLAVARWRGELSGLVLSSLADDSWTQLDLSGCNRLYAAEILAAAPRMPRLTALDVTGCERISAGGWRQLAQAWPQLQVIRLGGTATCSEEALKALTHILPGVPPPPHKAASTTAASKAQATPTAPPAAADSWEDAFASSDSEDDQDTPAAAAAGAHCSASSSSGSSSSDEQHPHAAGSRSAVIGSSSSVGGGRLKHLQALVWPDVPSAAVELVQQRCPRVLINPAIVPDRLTGELPPREWHPAALDAPLMDMVTQAALEKAGPDAAAAAFSAGSQSKKEPVVHIAERFKQAYIDRARRLKEKERRLAAAEERKQLKASHALRTLHAWLDERD